MPRAEREYLDTLNEAAFGAASEVQPKFTSHSDSASQWTAARCKCWIKFPQKCWRKKSPPLGLGDPPEY
nr:hypothetical protein [Pseudoruegeria sp. SK021]